MKCWLSFFATHRNTHTYNWWHLSCCDTIPGLTKAGYTEKEAENLIIRSIEFFKEARDEWWQAEGKASGRVYPLCLGAVGPYGAYLANGFEYRGNYGVSDEVYGNFISAAWSCCGTPAVTC